MFNDQTQRAILRDILEGGQWDMEPFAIEDFSAGPHRLIFRAMQVLTERQEPCDRVNVANELLKSNSLEAAGGLSYLVTLGDED